MIERMRPDPTPAELVELYAEPNDADRWAEHRLRVNITAELLAHRFHYRPLLIDPAAGTGALVRQLADESYGGIVTGDLAPDAAVTYPGTDALDTLAAVAADRGYDANAVVVLGEILEHVPAPLDLLVAAGRVAGGLVVSTPLEEPAGINPEHIWRWDKAGILAFFDTAGWRPLDYVELDLDIPGWAAPFRIQIHTAER